MATTYELIASTTVGSGGTTSIDFNTISASYTDLLISISARVDQSGAPNILMRFNSDTGANYTYKTLYGDGSSAGSYSQADTGNTFINIGYGTNSSNTANTFGNAQIYIPNYAGSNYKSSSSESVQETNATGAYCMLTAALWNNTSAITSISLYNINSGYKWVQYSTAYLYGIKNS